MSAFKMDTDLYFNLSGYSTSNDTNSMGGIDAVCYDDGRSGVSAINVPALVSVVVFYILMVVVGIWVSRRRDKRRELEDYIVAGRDLGLFVGIVTLTATWVGGGYLNGTAEKIFTPGYGNGVLWTQAPVCASLGLIVGGVMFARRMREAGYVTMLDPFVQKYGEGVTAIIFCVVCCANVFYSGAVLSALGATVTVITGLQYNVAVVVSAGVTLGYTLFGGLTSVAYTDILQLGCMVVGLWLAIPFALMHPAVRSLSLTATAPNSWLGEIKGGIWPVFYMDTALVLIFGGIPWQDYFQRVLSQRNARRAVICSVLGGLGCIVVAIPAYIIGVIAAATDWNATEYSLYATIPVPACDRKLALPMVLQFLTPVPVAVIGLGAVAAAVMSSADSSILSPGSLFAYNVYRPFRATIGPYFGKRQASNTEVLWVMRLMMTLSAAAACLVAIFSDTIYGLWFLSHDFGCFIMFPQLFCLMYFKGSNVYGSITGLCMGLFLRLSAGIPLLHVPALIEYPFYDHDTNTQLFPYRTMSMLVTSTVIAGVSMIANLLQSKNLVKLWFPVPVEYVASNTNDEGDDDEKLNDGIIVLREI